MVQKSVLVAHMGEKPEKTFGPHWMRHFFTRDVSPDNHTIIRLQQRAVWIGVACILQSLNEIDHHWYIPYLMPFGSLIPFALLLGSFCALWLAFRPTPARRLKQQSLALHPRRWQRVILVLTLILSLAGGIEFGRAAIMCFLPPEFSNDGTTLDTNAALLLLQGQNPYTASNFVALAQRFPFQATWTTPLRAGQFAQRLDYPSDDELQATLNHAIQTGQAPEFEAKVSYPALSFLTLVPFVWLHTDPRTINVLPLYLLGYLLLIALAWKAARPELRPWVLLLAMANVPMWSSTVGGNLDLICILLVVLSLLYREKRWISALCLGLALATKQPSWFFVPFYAILIWRTCSFREASYRLAISGSLFVAINLPFILWNPQAFFSGILAPLIDPMFPMGVGLINLSVTHLIPYLPERAYTVLELVAMAGALLWYWRLCRQHPEAALLLAVLPLFLAWRSLPSYFYCAAFPIFMLLAARSRRPAEPTPRAGLPQPTPRVRELTSAGAGLSLAAPRAASAIIPGLFSDGSLFFLARLRRTLVDHPTPASSSDLLAPN